MIHSITMQPPIADARNCVFELDRQWALLTRNTT